MRSRSLSLSLFFVFAAPVAMAQLSTAADAPAPIAPAPEAPSNAIAEVNYGSYRCDEGQSVTVQPVSQSTIRLTASNGVYDLAVSRGVSGAIRMESPAGAPHKLLWIQIPAKSFLLNTRIGQRVLDNCRPI